MFLKKLDIPNYRDFNYSLQYSTWYNESEIMFLFKIGNTVSRQNLQIKQKIMKYC